ncbi:MAG: hypothetical protein K5840_06710 [Eubacterium sp.]|nr:hypothetical protein [Eubacterium sp.]
MAIDESLKGQEQEIYELQKRLAVHGEKIVKETVKRADTLYVFCLWSAGDAVLIASYVHHLKRMRGFERAALVGKESHREAALMFDSVDEFIPIDSDSCVAVEQSALLFKTNYGENYVIGNLVGINSAQWELKAVGTPETAALFNQDKWFKTMILQIPDFYKCADVSEEFIYPYDEEKAEEWKKSVIIAPHTNTFGDLPMEFCAALTFNFTHRGYTVYTNAHGDEWAIPGSERLDAPFRDVYDMSRYCTGVISFRSGFTDFLAHNPTVRHVVINPDEYSCAFHDVKAWSESTNLINLIADEPYEHFTSQIVKFILDEE